MIVEMHRDPVPQFSADQVHSATQFLERARDAMQASIAGFKAESLNHANDDTIKMLQEKCRESARRLVLLFGDASSKFQGDRLKGQLVSIQESSQGQEVRQRLASLKSFFDTFTTAEWLGKLFATKEFQNQLSTVLSLLTGLLNPFSKASLSDVQQAESTLKKVIKELRTVAARLQPMLTRNTYGHGYGHYPQSQQDVGSLMFPEAPPAHLNESSKLQWKALWSQWNHLKSIQDKGLMLKGGNGNGYHANWQTGTYGHQHSQQTCGTNNGYHGHQYSQHGKESPAQNPLDKFLVAQAETMPVMERLQRLNQMCAALKSVFEEDERMKVEMQSCLKAKMENLADFAHILNDIVGIVKRYVLTHLADVGKDDISILKQWVTQEEATEVHQMLEEFRDEAIQARAFRAAAAMISKQVSDGSWKFTTDSEIGSAKDYLFENSVGHAQGAQIEEVNGSDNEELEWHDAQNSKKKGKSKHQREREAKWRASIPRTPSSGTYGS